MVLFVLAVNKGLCTTFRTIFVALPICDDAELVFLNNKISFMKTFNRKEVFELLLYSAIKSKRRAGCE